MSYCTIIILEYRQPTAPITGPPIPSASRLVFSECLSSPPLTTTMFPFNKKKKKIENALANNATDVELSFENLGKKDAEYLAEALKVNQTLLTLDLSYNSIGNEGAGKLAKALKVNQTLLTLDLWNNSIGDEGAGKLTEALKVNQTLQTTYLWNNSIGNKGAEYLAEALKVNQTLQTIDLGFNSIGNKGAEYLAEALKVNQTLQTINLEHNPIGNEGTEELAEALKVNQTLQTINLKSISIGNEGTEQLAEALKVNQTLLTINFWNNSIGNEGAGKLAEALKVNQTLQTIDLGFNSIGDKGAGKLAKALKVNRTLLTINLWNNSIGDEGAGKLAEALKVNQTLQTINLKSNSIGNEGTEKLAEALKVNQTLLTVNLRSNSIGSEGTEKLVEALKVNQTLLTIDLEYNSIGNEGAGKLAEALKVNQTLQTINLEHNSIGDEGAGKLAEALKVNQKLQTIDLSNNSIGDEGAGKFSEALKVNQTLQTIDLEDNSIDANVLRQIESILGDSERMEKRANKPTPQQSNFYSNLTTMMTTPQNIENQLEQVKQLIQDLHMTKFFYTAVSSMWRAGVLTKDITSCQIVASLEKSRELCTGADEIADFKLLLEKAESDGHIDRRQMHSLDNNAERNAVFNDQRFVSLMEAVKSNTARIEGLEANVEAINNSVNAIRKGLKHKMKVEAVVGFLSATINAVSFGVGGNIVAATASALGSIVDYGDIVHIQSVAAKYGNICVEQVEAGVDIALNKYADKKLEEAVKRGKLLTVVAAAAVMMHPTAATKPLDDENFESPKQKGDAAFRRGDFVDAMKYYSTAIDENKTSSCLFCNRSVVYRKMGDAENALVDASTAIEHNSKYSRAYYCKGKALQDLKQFDDAHASFEKGLAISPGDALLKTGLNQLLTDTEFKSHRAVILNEEGIALFGEGNFLRAVQCYSNAIDLDNSNHYLFLGRACAYMELGDFENALRDAVISVDLDSSNPRGYYIKGRAFQSMKCLQEAMSAFEEGLSKCPTAVELKEGLALVKTEIRLQAYKKDPDGDHIFDVTRKEVKNCVPTSHMEGENPKIDKKGGDKAESLKFRVVEGLLLTWLHGVDKSDIVRYSKCLIEDGFDTIDAIRTVEDDDLNFMKKGHKRVLLKKISEPHNNNA